MALLDRLSGWITRLLGLHLVEQDPWQVTAPRDAGRFIRALPLVATRSGAIAYFEGPDPDLAEYLRQVSVRPHVRVAAETFWPRPVYYHVPITAENMIALAVLADKQATRRICRRCHVYVCESMLLEWGEAFTTQPIRISRKLDIRIVRRFAAAIGSSVVPDERSSRLC